MSRRRATSIATLPRRPRPAARPGSSAQRWAPRLLAVVALVALSAVAALTPAGAAAPGRAEPTLTLAGQTPWVSGTSPFTVDVRVAGAPEGATVDMVVHDYVESRAQFRDTLDGELGPTTRRIAPQPLASLPSTAPGTVQVGFTPDAALGSRGVYPVEVRLLSPDGDAVASLVTYLSYFTADDEEFPPLEVAVVVDVAAPPALQTDGTYALPPEATEHARQRIEAVQRAGDTQVTLAPRPETIEGLIGEGGGESPEVDDLRALAATRQVLARPFVDVDLASLRDAGLLSEANSQAEGGADVVRSRLAVEPAGGVWLSGATWGADAAQQAVDLGLGRAIVPPTAVGDGASDQDVPTTPVRLGGEAGPLAMVTDPDLAAHLTGDDGMIAAHRFLAELAITWREAPSDPRAVVVHLPATGAIDPDVVGTALAGLAGGPALRAVPVTQIFDDVPVDEEAASVGLAPHPDGPDLRSLAPPLESVRSRVAGVGSLLDDPGVGAGLEHSLLLSTGTDTPGDDRRAYVQRADDALSLVSGAVSLPDEFRITLTARSSTIPITLENNLEQDLAVRIELDSDQLEFPEGAVIDQVLPPGTTRVEVPVRTRTSGAFTLDVRVTSPDQTIVLDTSTFDIRSTAISGVGLVLSVGAGLFLAVWWARNWRKTRRTRRRAPGGPGEATSGAPAAADPTSDAPQGGIATPVAGATPEAPATPAPAPAGPAVASRGGPPAGPGPRSGVPPATPSAGPGQAAPGGPDYRGWPPSNLGGGAGRGVGPPAAAAPSTPDAAPAPPVAPLGSAPPAPSRPPAPPLPVGPAGPPRGADQRSDATPRAPHSAPPPGPGPPRVAPEDEGHYRPAHMASSRSGRRLPLGPSRRPPGRGDRSS